MSIKVYPSTMRGAPIEVHECYGITIGQWFDQKGLDRGKFDVQPVSVKKNGELISPELWDDVYIGKGDVVDIWVMPHGGVFKALGSLVGGVFKFLFSWAMPSSRTPRYGSPERGSRIEPSEARANTARMGEVVPELAGRHIRYPDYLNQPRRYFRNQREQWLEFLCCIGPGHYEIPSTTVKVGDTSFQNVGGDASYTVYEPNANLSNDPAHQNWYNADEVGGTSSGTAGLELSVERASRENDDAPEYHFDGSVVSRSTGEFPDGWSSGTVVQIHI